ncbi:hypothetical protein GTQ99_00725 [Kineococcus sp. T13]|uniref:P-loop NTPase fold protein n=1 Tax=Kineococcus vitellinus TaxID=2696565 RepID=UPI001412A1DF|nr:P-loop NTPase fold protein [Kineococcus vitellinus]NAZ73956.1 hypothetical protein [Kineococcus vitellinus]
MSVAATSASGGSSDPDVAPVLDEPAPNVRQPEPLGALLRKVAHDGGWRDLVVSTRSWPDGELKQSEDRWLQEARTVLAESQHASGRYTALALCLLDTAVADAAVRSGQLAALLGATSAEDVLSAHGIDLLRARAPVVALSLGVLPPATTTALAYPRPVNTIAIGEQGGAQPEQVRRWATVMSDSRGAGEVYAGDLAVGVRVARDVDVAALGWSRSGRLSALLRRFTPDAELEKDEEAQWNALGGGEVGVLSWHPRAKGRELIQGWPPVRAGAVGGDGLVAVDAAGNVLWGVPGHGPSPVAAPVHPAHAATAGAESRDERFIALERDDQLWISTGGDDGFVQVQAELRHVVSLLATDEHAVVVDEHQVRWLSWRGQLLGTADLGSMAPRFACAAARSLVAVAGEHDIALLCLYGDRASVIARWQVDAEVTAVALSPDGAAVGIATADARVRYWRLDQHTELRLSGYDADSPHGEDLLDVEPMVDVLAALVSARAVEPPLAVGIFGAWGSGKTFFMERLHRRVAELARGARASGRSQEALWSWRTVVQVRFNAWHYSAADVWAALLEQLFRELVRSGTTDSDLPEELDHLHRARMEALAGTRVVLGAAHDELTEAEELERNAQVALGAEQRRVREAQEQVSRAPLEAARARVRSGVLGAVAAALVHGGAPTVLSGADLGRAGARTIEVIRKIARWKVLLPVILTCLLAAIVTASTDVIGKVLGPALFGSVSVLALLLRFLRPLTDGLQAAVEAEEDAKGALRQARAQLDAAQDDARLASERASKARAALDAARAAAEEASRSLSDGSRGFYREFVERRDGSGEYRSRLGVLGQVRTDLDTLAWAVAKHNRELANDDVLNRVVLYVDDLDRCPPDVVVRVMEAVHLLLTYPMFVVVVGVDQQWVSKALRAVYPEMLEADGLTPLNYLEKIFQIPVWLDPPGVDATRDMLGHLLGEPLSDPTSRQRDGWVSHRSMRRHLDSTTGRSTLNASADAGADRRTEVLSSVESAISTPDPLQMSFQEVYDVGSLAPLLTRSPRAVKRFVNTYRLLKLLLPDHELRIARWLLALVTGHPEVADRLIDAATAAGAEDEVDDITADWNDRDRILMKSGGSFLCADVAAVSQHVRKFSFRSR